VTEEVMIASINLSYTRSSHNLSLQRQPAKYQFNEDLRKGTLDVVHTSKSGTASTPPVY